MKMILAALDLEAGSDAVLARAVQLASAHAAQLMLLHVIGTETLSDVADMSGHRESDLRRQLAQQEHAAVERLLVESGRSRRTDVRIEFGSPHEVITRVAGELSADLIVIGAHKGLSVRDKFLGSTADRVIRMSPAPVLVVKNRSAEPYQKVAVAVDLSLQSAAAAREAHKLVPGAKLQLIHVISMPPTFEQALSRVGTPRAAIEKYRSAKAAKARHELSEFARDTAGLGEVVTQHLAGDPGPALVHFSHTHSVDLLVLGPHGHGIILQQLLGSVTQRILRETTCDVLVGSTRQ
jgi:universal stress protein E